MAAAQKRKKAEAAAEEWFEQEARRPDAIAPREQPSLPCAQSARPLHTRPTAAVALRVRTGRLGAAALGQLSQKMGPPFATPFPQTLRRRAEESQDDARERRDTLHGEDGPQSQLPPAGIYDYGDVSRRIERRNAR